MLFAIISVICSLLICKFFVKPLFLGIYKEIQKIGDASGRPPNGEDSNQPFCGGLLKINNNNRVLH